MSRRPTEYCAIVDAGLKALAFDSGPPLVCDEPAATYERASDEHGRLGISGATNRLGLGDKIRLVPGNCDPTVNLYDWYVGIRGNRKYFVVDGPAMTAETRANGGLGAQPYRSARVAPRM
jgi:D-serine deaminase-like pyridoxal phosphate-dependent protein